MKKCILGLLVASAVILLAIYIRKSLRLANVVTDRSAIKQNLKRSMLALHNYHDLHNSVAPVFVMA